MAENKKSFILYADLLHTLELMPDDTAGRLFKHILMYVNDLEPVAQDLVTQLTFEPIKQQLKRDLKHWENSRSARSDAGKKGMEKRWGITTDNNVITNDNNDIKNITKITANVNVNVNVINIEERKLKFANSLKVYLDIYGKDMLNDFYRYWSEPNKSNTKFKQELERTWDLKGRLETWSKRDRQFTKQQPQETKQPTLKEFK